MSAIRATGLCKRYGDRLALDGLDLAVRDGELSGYLGANGGGQDATEMGASGRWPPPPTLRRRRCSAGTPACRAPWSRSD